MSLSASEIFDAIAPHLKDDPNKNTHLELAAGDISACVYGSNYNKALAYMAAHSLTLANRPNGAGGAVAAISEGDQSLSFQNPYIGTSALNQTAYGQTLLLMQAGHVTGVSIANTALNLPCKG